VIAIYLNYFFYRHQILLMRAATAASMEARAAHKGLARGYETRIDDLQRDAGVEPMLAEESKVIDSSSRDQRELR
jgi:hypothetical protein